MQIECKDNTFFSTCKGKGYFYYIIIKKNKYVVGIKDFSYLCKNVK